MKPEIFGKATDSCLWVILFQELRLSENPATDPGKGGSPRFVLIARLAKVKILNGSEVKFYKLLYLILSWFLK